MRWKSCAAIGWFSKRSDRMRWKSMGLVVAGAIALLAAGGWVVESWRCTLWWSSERGRSTLCDRGSGRATPG
jgi:hypothetical protein